MAVEHSTLTGSELHIPFNYGSDSGKSGTPDVGDWYFATDTLILYFCITNNAWLQLPLKVFPARQNDLLISSSSTTPEGWDDVSSTYNNRFMRIDSGTPLSTGGTDSHSHSDGSLTGGSHSHGNGSLYIVSNCGSGYSYGGSCYGFSSTGSISVYGSTDSASVSVSGSTGTSANVPAYIQIKLYKKNSNDVSSYS